MTAIDSPMKRAGMDSVRVRHPAGENLIRGDTYSLLAALLRSPPATELLDAVRRLNTAEVPDALSEAWQDLIRAAQRCPPEQIRDDYGRLFIGLGCGEVIPYASWYDDGVLMSRALARLRKDLGRLGLVRRESVAEPEDHAAALCETMTFLVCPGGVDGGRQGEFFKKHIGPWMPRLFDTIRVAGSPGFYGATGNLGFQFIRSEQAFFSRTASL